MSLNSISSRSTRALTWGVAGAIGKVVAQLMVQITLARLLDPLAFGQYTAVLLVYGLGYNIADGGFGSALIQKKELHTGDVSMALGWSLLSAIVISLLIIACSDTFAHLMGDATLALIFKVCALLIPFQVVSNISSSLLRRELHMRGIQIIQFLAYFVFFGGLATALALMGYGVWSLVAGFAAQTVFSLVATYWLARHTLRPRLQGDSTLVHFGLKSMATELTGSAMDTVDRLLVGKFWGIYSLGLYSVAYNLSKAPVALLLSTAQSITFASTARLHGNWSAVRKGYLIVLSAVVLTTLPVFTLAAFESGTVLHIIYGQKWIKAAPYMTALALTVPLISMCAVTAAILRGSGQVGQELRGTMISTVALIAGFLLLQHESLVVAVWSVPLSYLLRFLILQDTIRHRLGLHFSDLILACRGALVMSATGLCMAVLVRSSLQTTAGGLDALPLLAGCCAIAGLLMLRFNWLLGAPLAEMVRQKFSAGPFGPALDWLQRGRI